MSRRLAPASLAVALALSLAGAARAASGDYALDGGTTAEQAQVTLALDASAFDSDLLDTGEFAWGAVQMEYAQQVQLLRLDQRARAQLTEALGAKDWCYALPGVAAQDEGCERFAAALAWAYWPSAANAMKPQGPGDWSAQLPAEAFRALLARLLAAGSG
jgi:hypothetical protein